MSALRLSPAAAYAAAAMIGAALAGCSAPPAKRFSETEPLRTADIVHAPTYDAASAPAASAGAPPAVADVAPPPAATVQAIAQPAPAAAPAALAEVPQPVAPSPVPAAHSAAPSSEPAARGVAPASAPAVGTRWAVQVGVFAVPANAEKVRARVESRLAQSDVAPAQRVVRVERIGDRSHVLVGDLPDRKAADALAAQLRRALNQDVVVLRR